SASTPVKLKRRGREINRDPHPRLPPEDAPRDRPPTTPLAGRSPPPPCLRPLPRPDLAVYNLGLNGGSMHARTCHPQLPSHATPGACRELVSRECTEDMGGSQPPIQTRRQCSAFRPWR